MSKPIRNQEQLDSGMASFRFPEVSQETQPRHGADAAQTIPAFFSHARDRHVSVTAYHFRDLTHGAQERGEITPAPQRSDPPSPIDAATQTAAMAQAWENERERLRRQAQEASERYLIEAREEAESLKHNARLAGYQAGEEQARQEMTAQFSPVLASLQQALAQATRVHEERLRAAEEDIVELAFQLARKIVQHEIRCNRQVVMHTVRQAFEQLGDQDEMAIHVNPADLEQIRALQDELRRQSHVETVIDLKGDEAIDRGGCLIHSSFGTLDMQIETQFEELVRQFNEGLRSEG